MQRVPERVLTEHPEPVSTHSSVLLRRYFLLQPTLTLKLPPPRSPDTARSDGRQAFAACSVVCLQRRTLPLCSARPEAPEVCLLWQWRPRCWSVPGDLRRWGPPWLFCRRQTGAGSGFDAVACSASFGERRRPGWFLWGSRLRLQDRKKISQELRRKPEKARERQETFTTVCNKAFKLDEESADSSDVRRLISPLGPC